MKPHRVDIIGDVLWVSDEAIPTEADLAKCDNCGAERSFEFQILPQNLNHLKVSSKASFFFGLQFPLVWKIMHQKQTNKKKHLK